MLFFPTLLLAFAQEASGAIATAERHATDIGAAILAQGGNAVDAAIATHFALSVSFPNAGNLAGGGFLVYRSPDGESWFLDFREVAPAKATPDMFQLDGVSKDASRQGWRAVGVPGAVFGMAEAHRQWGSLPWSTLIQPSTKLARDGFRVSSSLSKRLSRYATELAEDPLAGAIFAPGGKAIPEGYWLKQSRLAQTLDLVSEQGESAFRKGIIVEGMLEASEAGGGVLSAQDFEKYQAVLRPLHSISWNGVEVLAPSAPSSGGVFLTQTLKVLERFPLAVWGWNDSRTVQIIGEASAAAFVDRNQWLGDPAGFHFDPSTLLDEEQLQKRAHSLSPKRYTKPSKQVSITPSESTETTHFSIVDVYGGAVSLTTTLNGNFGAKVMAPGGFLMNNEMDDFATHPGEANQFGLIQGAFNSVQPGHRPLSSMSPVIVLKDDQVDAVLGSPGGPRILSSVLQVLLNRYVFGMSPQRAVSAPRLHRQDLPAELRFERGRLPSSAISELRRIGQPLKELKVIGSVYAIFRSWDGSWAAIADPRHDGTSAKTKLQSTLKTQPQE